MGRRHHGARNGTIAPDSADRAPSRGPPPRLNPRNDYSRRWAGRSRRVGGGGGSLNDLDELGEILLLSELHSATVMLVPSDFSKRLRHYTLVHQRKWLEATGFVSVVRLFLDDVLVKLPSQHEEDFAIP